MNYLPDIAWSTRVEDVELSSTPYHFYCTVNPLDPNDPGFGEIEIGYILLDFNGYPFEVVGFGDDDDDDDKYRIEVYDINERGDGTNSAYAPYPDRQAYIYEPKNSGVILSQAQLRKLDRSAADVIEPIEKGVLWAHRGLEITPNEQLGIENITALRLSDKFTLDEEEEGWQGGKSYKLGLGNLSVGTVTSVAALTLGTTGTDVSSSVANGTTTPVITLNIPTASAANRGALSSADWTTFNNKQNTLVSGTNIKTVAGNSLLGDSNVINIRVSATEPTSIGAISGDIWIEP